MPNFWKINQRRRCQSISECHRRERLSTHSFYSISPRHFRQFRRKDFARKGFLPNFSRHVADFAHFFCRNEYIVNTLSIVSDNLTGGVSAFAGSAAAYSRCDAEHVG